jgi:hypothetical protein
MKVLVAILALFLAAVDWPPTPSPPPPGAPGGETTVSAYKQRRLDEISPFVFANRYKTYEAIDQIANMLWHSHTIQRIVERRTNTFPQFPILLLYDRDGDSKPEEFSYEPEGGGESQEFGFFFDLNRDGKADYVVFNGGPMFTKDLKQMIWMNYHGIDTNYDGKVDVQVLNAIDLNGDTFPEPGATTWFYDRDFDGRMDDGEYLAPKFQEPVERNGDILVSKRAFSFDKSRGGGPKVGDDFEFYDGLLSDINAAFR